MPIYLNRKQAGVLLAESLIQYRDTPNTIILALPRGGVPVAYEVATRLHAPLDVFLVRKLGAPGNAELAMGAIAQGGAVILNPSIVNEYQVTQEEMELITAREQAELARREQAYRGMRPALLLQDKTIILIDDGIATGSTMQVAIKALREQSPKAIIVAVPVADQHADALFKRLADGCICPMVVDHLQSVGGYYKDFSQTEDEEVRQLLS